MSDIRRFELTPLLSKALVAGGRFYISGLTAQDKSGGVFEQTKDILAQIDHYLDQVGADKTRLVKVNIWLTDVADFSEMNNAWKEWVDPDCPPTRATVGAPLAGSGSLVEIMAEGIL